MTARRFVDTNILIYAATARNEAPDKFAVAERIVRQDLICLSAQVLQEFFVNVTWKPKEPLTPDDARVWVYRLAEFPCAEIDAPIVKAALSISQRHRIHYWDAAILAAAERLGAAVVYTEDLNHGQTYGSVRVENPFI